MSNKDSRSGGKYNGNHTTLTPVAVMVADVAAKCEYVTRISPGFIKSGLHPTSVHRVKIAKDGNSILLTARGGVGSQEVRVHYSNYQEALEYIARGARNAGIAIHFTKD